MLQPIFLLVSTIEANFAAEFLFETSKTKLNETVKKISSNGAIVYGIYHNIPSFVTVCTINPLVR